MMARLRPASAAVLALALAACGRSELLIDLPGPGPLSDDQDSGGIADATFPDDVFFQYDVADDRANRVDVLPADAVVPPACNGTACPNGCCGPSGICLPGTAGSACGAGGSVCFDCGALNEQCDPIPGKGGSCAASPACSAATCAGCCDGDVCVPAGNPQKCGAFGQPCEVCAPGNVCKGACVGPQLNCGPANCAGCCASPNMCASGTADVACGSAGAACMRCVPTEGTGQCIAGPAGKGGTCTNQICDARTCGSGCCAGGTCMNGETSAACGGAGLACQACAPNEACLGHKCVPGPICSPQTCAGCCSGNTCEPGNHDGFCGTGGFVCTNCTTFNHQACLNGTCVVPVSCSPATCRGCCYGNVCAEGDQEFLCGAGGGACQSCTTSGKHCMNGACQ